jgi:23S rRNA pseudouridine1911/1915/1917 synthase
LSLNNGFRYRERLPEAAHGRTLVRYLSERYRHSSALEWERRIEDGLVLVEGAPAPADRPLAAGESLVWNRPPWQEPRAPVSFAVLYEDEDVLGVAKPAGLPTLPGGSFLENTLLARVRRRNPQASPLHRLGRGTSGIVLFALNREARRALTRSWESSVERRYRGIVTGLFPGGEAILDHPIGLVPHSLLGSVHAVSAAGKRARSRVRLLEHRGDRSLVEIEIATGRTHQIRIHLAAAGHPLLGDPMYPPGGVPAPAVVAPAWLAADGVVLPGETGYSLHAHRVGFAHPRTSKEVVILCGPPPLYRARTE